MRLDMMANPFLPHMEAKHKHQDHLERQNMAQVMEKHVSSPVKPFTDTLKATAPVFLSSCTFTFLTSFNL